MTDAEMNKAVAEWLGLCWHGQIRDGLLKCICGMKFECGSDFMSHLTGSFPNPDFAADPLALLAEMRKSGSLLEFTYDLCISKAWGDRHDGVVSFTNILLTPDGKPSTALLRAVYEWGPGRKEKV